MYKRQVRDIAFEDVTRIILVDTKSPRRINRLAELLLRPEVDVHIYDHHPWAEEDARGSLEIVETVGAAVTLLVEQDVYKRQEIRCKKKIMLFLPKG